MPINLNVAEAAKVLGCSQMFVRQKIWQRQLGCYRIGRKVMVSDAHILEFLSKCENKPAEIKSLTRQGVRK